MEHSKTLVILPCAGFGQRMGMKNNESKEMLKDLYNDNKPLIDWHLDKLKDYQTVVVTREEKTDLIDYLAEKQIFTLLLNDVSKEWPNSVLYSKVSWEENNILVLPDTRFEPTDIVSRIDQELQNGFDLVFAVHKVEDCSKWGKVFLDPYSNKPLYTQEKPELAFKLDGLAWGLIGFKKPVGESLFQAYLDKTIFNLTKLKVKIIYLNSFKDITRTGKIESY